MVLFIICKWLSYGASALLHLYPFKSSAAVTSALKLDLIAVPLSVLGTPAPVMNPSSKEWIGWICGGIFLTTINAALVKWQFKGHVGLDTPKGRSDTPRSIIVFLFFIGACVQLARHYGVRDIWFLAVAFYLMAFACSIPVTQAHMREVGLFGVLPWHKRQIYGTHEDFHALLFLADFLSAVIGGRILLNPVIDRV